MLEGEGHGDRKTHHAGQTQRKGKTQTRRIEAFFPQSRPGRQEGAPASTGTAMGMGAAFEVVERLLGFFEIVQVFKTQGTKWPPLKRYAFTNPVVQGVGERNKIDPTPRWAILAPGIHIRSFVGPRYCGLTLLIQTNKDCRFARDLSVNQRIWSVIKWSANLPDGIFL